MADFLPVHIRSDRTNSHLNLVLLLIPSLVFFLVLTFLVFQIKSQGVATTNRSDTLGTEAETLDGSQ